MSFRVAIMKKIIAIFAIAMPLLSSCGSKSLENYAPIIEDTIRGELAAANFIYNGANSFIDDGLSIIGSLLDHLGYSRLANLTDYLRSDNLGNEIYSLHKEKGLTYLDALTRISNDGTSLYSEYAAMMIDVYKSLEISICNVSILKDTSTDKEWRMVEENTRVVFFFCLSELDTATPSYDCFADEASLEEYIDNLRTQETKATTNDQAFSRGQLL